MTKKDWQKNVYEPFVSKKAEREESFTTVSNAEVPALISAEDLAGFSESNDLGFPGTYPYTRGVYPSMYRGRLWTMRQFAGFGTAVDTNKRFKFLLEQGQTGLSTAFHFPTLMGHDSDDSRSRGEVGVCGVAIDSLADMETLFDGIPLEKVTVSMTINGPAAIMLAFFIATAQNQGCDLNKVGGTIQNDVLKEYIAQNSYLVPPDEGVKLVVDTIEYCAKHMPKWNPVSISGYHIREAGSTAAQELAFTLYDGLEYVKHTLERGLDVDEFAPRLSFFFNSHLDFFEEIAKFRAARRIWAKEMKKRYNPKSEASMRCRFHVQTAGCTLTAQQPENNIVRTTLQALAAVLGGGQSLHTNSMDETLALPTEKAVRIALRTQQIIAEESGVASTIDPLGGSYFVEHMTNQIEEEAMKIIAQLDEMGGMLAAIKEGWPMLQIADASRTYQTQVEKGEKVIVGVNKYMVDDEEDLEVLKISHDVEAKQIERLKKVREERNDAEVKRKLENLRKDIQDQKNVMPALVDCAHAYCTIGEIAQVLRDEYGEYHDPGWY